MNALKKDGTTVEDTRIVIPRQVRYVDDENKVQVEVNGQSYELRNYSRFGLGIIAEKADERITKQVDLAIQYSGHRVYEGTGKIVYRRPHQGTREHVGIELDAELPIEQVMGMKDAEKLLESLGEETGTRQALKAEFVESVEELSLYLARFKEKVDAIEKRTDALPLEQKQEYIASFRQIVAIALERKLNTQAKKIDGIITADELKRNTSYTEYIRERITPHFKDADIVRRLVAKPLGYAGDFETLNQIVRRGFEGRTLFGQVAHHCVVQSYPSRMVHLRRNFFSDKLKELLENCPNGDKVKILAVAPGPAGELQKLLHDIDAAALAKADVHLLDVDDRPLMYAQTRLFKATRKTARNLKMRFVCCGVSEEFRARRDALAMTLDPSVHLESYDYIYVPYLCDYLDMNMNTVLIRKLSHALTPRGVLCAAHLAPLSAGRAFFHLALDWSVYFKSENDVLAAVPAGVNGEVLDTGDADELNIYVCLGKK